MSYLDDPDHTWQLDPATIKNTDPLRLLAKEMALADEEGIKIILQGYHGLKLRLPNATDAECLDTSMIWYFG